MSTFTRCTRDGDTVHKQLAPAAVFAAFTDALCRDGLPAITGYLATLRAAGVRLPDRLELVDGANTAEGRPARLGVRHRWIDGRLLPEIITTDPARAVTAIRTVLGWLTALENTDARIDTNLANFCLPDDGAPVLIDLLPPLIPSARPAARTPFETLFDALCFDTTLTRAAMLGYAARALLQAGHTAAAANVLRLAPATAGTAFPAAWFGARLTLARAATEDRVPLQAMLQLFERTSVLALSRLRPGEQRRRVHDTQAAVEACAA
ncbi:hypothetical protein M8542_36535 [Amycolatopsis sp. OK19-0408]|uniref:Uncharacterized protein n=1 Tax=Amycolatopsis iheyensis TaxID=2945988 RepID=A0A9X2NIA0_9PSEU|nr:hypothetical protein [Amycolatopsis iheyensis]MCR6488353.1 hypothetical protein [Amycolatopsis iheyensis]